MILRIDLVIKIKNIVLVLSALLLTSLSFALPAAVGTAILSSFATATGITMLAVSSATVIANGVAAIVIGPYAGSRLLGAMKMDFPDDMSA